MRYPQARLPVAKSITFRLRSTEFSGKIMSPNDDFPGLVPVVQPALTRRVVSFLGLRPPSTATPNGAASGQLAVTRARWQHLIARRLAFCADYARAIGGSLNFSKSMLRASAMRAAWDLFCFTARMANCWRTAGSK